MMRAACQKKGLSLIVLITILSGLLLCGCTDNNEQITSFSQLREPGRVIAVSTDTPETALVMKEFDKATIESCTDIFPAYQEVANGKTDACIYARLQMELAIKNGVSGVCLQMTRKVPLRTTEQSKEVLKDNFPDRDESDLLPAVRKGTALSGDNFWKGVYGHATANFISKYYDCPDPYMVTEMEEVAIANTADCFGMLDRIILLRVIVNLDVFLDGATPESTWGEHDSYNEKVEENNDETLDIFEPAMHNLFDTGSVVINEILEGKL